MKTKTRLVPTLVFIIGAMAPLFGGVNQMEAVRTMRIYVDNKLGKQVATIAMSEVLRMALQHGFDVKARVFNGDLVQDWTPPRSLTLNDFHISLADEVFRGGVDHAREGERGKRLAAALKSFSDYFQSFSGSPQPCSKLVGVAKEIAIDASPITLLVLGNSICSSPNVTLRLQRDRMLDIMVVPGTDTDQQKNDCVQLEAEKRVAGTFPHAPVFALVNADTLADIVLNRGTQPNSATVVIRGCRPSDARGSSGLTLPSSAFTDNGQAKVLSEGERPLRIIWPQPHSGEGRTVPFQGDGAEPGEILVPIVKINDEFWPQDFVMARTDGSFTGTIILGRPSNDCGRLYEFRLFGGVTQKLIVGVPVGAWPVAKETSLPVTLIRTRECGASER
jgi:hypothetical protein